MWSIAPAAGVSQPIGEKWKDDWVKNKKGQIHADLDKRYGKCIKTWEDRG